MIYRTNMPDTWHEKRAPASSYVRAAMTKEAGSSEALISDNNKNNDVI